MTSSPTPTRRRRGLRVDELAVRCPACGRRARAAAVRSPGGWVHAGRMDARTLRTHAECDLFDLAAEFSRAALADCRLRIPALYAAPDGER